MKLKMLILTGITILILTGCATSLKMNPPSKLELSDINQYGYTVGLFVPQEVKEYVYEKSTSPVDKMAFPIGEQTNEIFKINMPLVFKSVVEVSAISSDQNTDLVIKPSIVKFESVIPFPAYNPYTGTIVYRVEVYNKKGEKIYTQTTTGNGQTSKGLLSGFSARSICAEVAQMAMEDAVKQILEGLSEAEELQNIN